MSMTQIAFLKKADIPSKEQLQKSIRELGYEFQILDDLTSPLDQEGLVCKIDGHETYLEINLYAASKIANEEEWLKEDLTDQDTAIVFTWGADFAAGACVELVSLALVDNCKALVYFMDDELKYSREMLLDDIPAFLTELRRKHESHTRENAPTVSKQPIEPKKSFWERLKDIFR